MTVYHLYFSPCETTYDATYVFCRAVSQNAAVEVNLTDRETEVPDMPAGSVAVVAGPVYAGRIPAPMADKCGRTSKIDPFWTSELTLLGRGKLIHQI